jgi:hypothetical protein
MKILSCLFFILVSVSACSQKVVQPLEANKATTAKLPSQVLNLTNWKLTIPINTSHSGNPDEIKRPELDAYTSDNYFFTSTKGNTVTFRVNAGGATTSGSHFPRSELREMANNGMDEASWSSAEGTHTLFIDQQINHLPEVRRHMVVGQIHDDSKYIMFFRIEDKKLLISVNGGSRDVLDENYVLGTRFTVKLVVHNNETQCYYNNELKYTYKASFSGAYFKAGAYLQSSCQGDKKTEGESCNAYGEVEIYNVWVKHE